MTTVFLVRHALHTLGAGILAGRTPSVGLTEKGRAQAERVADRLAQEGITALQASPLERAQETAHPIAARCGPGVETVEALNEVDFGDWSGKSFDELDTDPTWAGWNAEREYASTPAGETIAALAKRVVGHIEHIRATDPAGRVVLVSHAEPIRTAILHYLGLPFSAFMRIEIDPASISQIVFADGNATLAGLNERVSA